LTELGVEVEQVSPRRLSLSSPSVRSFEAPYELVKTMRASVLVLGPLLARCGRARVSLPGGCSIGARPIDFHMAALEKLGAKVKLQHGFVEAVADGLRGTEIYFDNVTVTGTENVLMAASLARGETILQNCAQEPEVIDLAELLNRMGARIDGAGTRTIRVEGVERLHGAEHNIIPDRIEAGTYLAAGALIGDEIEITDCRPGHMTAAVDKLEELGGRVERGETSIRIARADPIRPANVRTLPHPGFPTDMQAQLMVLLTQAGGTSLVTETIFENRFMHVS
ncbi:MAG: UDP-N-acetylglucosamine 1-carboxyvinyltransferase, partial [bacterium]|nr:UDP-N-acetylglucosamine 1-carboxyvinyltransferase [bacterium]